MAIADEDSIGSVIACEKLVQFYGGGVCAVPPGSIRPGRHMELKQAWWKLDVHMTVKP